MFPYPAYIKYNNERNNGNLRYIKNKYKVNKGNFSDLGVKTTTTTTTRYNKKLNQVEIHTTTKTIKTYDSKENLNYLFGDKKEEDKKDKEDKKDNKEDKKIKYDKKDSDYVMI